jgi:RNA polymerase sigma-70 factor, ECF subfamily
MFVLLEPLSVYTDPMEGSGLEGSFHECTDEFVMALVAARDELALCELYKRFAKRVHALARKMLSSASEADDVTQDVFVKVWQNANVFLETRGKAAAWLMTVAHHASVDALRRRQVRRTEHPEAEELERFADFDASDPLERAMMARALGALNTAERHLIELAFFEGLSHAQVAARTELPLGTVKSRLRLCLEKLRMALGASVAVES